MLDEDNNLILAAALDSMSKRALQPSVASRGAFVCPSNISLSSLACAYGFDSTILRFGGPP